MNPREPSIHIAGAMLRASEHPRMPDRKEPMPAFTIALSREVGAGGTSVARELGRRLNWPVYDHELLQQLAQDLKVSIRQLEDADEKPGSWLQGAAEAFATVPSVTESAYFLRLLRTLRNLGQQGQCVIVGRGAAHLLPPDSTLRVRLLATLEDRITAISRDQGLSRADAARYLDRKERERIRFIKDHFQKDPTDPQNYDLVLNTSRFSVAECVDLILEALRRLQPRATEKAATEGAPARPASV